MEGLGEKKPIKNNGSPELPGDPLFLLEGRCQCTQSKIPLMLYTDLWVKGGLSLSLNLTA